MKQNKTIKVAVKTDSTLNIDQLVPLQGDLKTLSKENYEKLKTEILEDGFSFAIHVWEDVRENKIYILDGHQRHATLTKMKKEGYSLPAVPVLFVDAENIDHAKKKLAAAASQYGQFNQAGAEAFFKSFKKFDPADFTTRFNMPEINHDAFDFSKKDDGKKTEVTFTAGEGGGKEKTVTDEKEYMIIITCDDEQEQQDLFNQLQAQDVKCKII